MATRRPSRKGIPIRQSQPSSPEPAPDKHYTCRDCDNSYDWFSKALDGHKILCRCKYDKGTEYGRWGKLLRDPACSQFKIRTEKTNL